MKSFRLSFFLASLISFSAVVAKSTVVQSDIFYEISKGNVRAVSVWLKTQPDLSIKNDKGQTLLGVAVVANKRSIVKSLVKAGANVNALDSASKTALDCAVELDNARMAAFLAKYSAKVTSQENMYRFKDLIRAYANKLFIRVFIIGLVLSITLPIWPVILEVGIGTFCDIYRTILLSKIVMIAMYGSLLFCEFILNCRAISWNRAANRFDGLLTDAVVEPVVVLEK